jgi:hypothetical protein
VNGSTRLRNERRQDINLVPYEVVLEYDYTLDLHGHLHKPGVTGTVFKQKNMS